MFEIEREPMAGPINELFDDSDDETANTADLGAPTWIEYGAGFPVGGLGSELASEADQPAAGISRAGGGAVVVDTPDGPFTESLAAQMVAFTEFLAGTAFAADERQWLIDATAREFLEGPGKAIEQMAQITNAVDQIPDLEPVERAFNRLKALTAIYLTEPLRERLGKPETPVMVMLKAHNPALVIDPAGVVVTGDAIDARHQLNELVLHLAGHTLDELPHLRADLATSYLDRAAPMKAELAGSQLRLVTLRTWLSFLPQVEIDRLQGQLADVLVSATDLDMVALQLCFRSTLEALVEDDDD